jgi:hypothetical protein
MLERIQDYFYSELGRITGLGLLIVRVGSALLLAGLIGHFMTTAINIVPTLAHQAESGKTLADIFPTWPLWWVPETWISAIALVLLIAGGLCLVAHGKQVDRLLKM